MQSAASPRPTRVDRKMKVPSWHLKLPRRAAGISIGGPAIFIRQVVRPRALLLLLRLQLLAGAANWPSACRCPLLFKIGVGQAVTPPGAGHCVPEAGMKAPTESVDAWHAQARCARGAARCDFVDADREALTAVEQHLNTLDASDRSTLQCGSAAEYLSAAQGGWDIVFVDPPFEAQLGESTLQQIATAGCLSNNNRVYYETSLSNPEPIPEMLYEVVREKTAGDVRYQLLTLRRA